MKKIILLSLALAILLVGCGGGSSKSGLKKNKYVGSLPAIYADYALAKKADEAKIDKLYKKGNFKKIMKEAEKQEKEQKLRRKKFDADIEAEKARIAGTEIPVSYSKDLQASDMLFYNVAPVKLNERCYAEVFLSAKQDFTVPGGGQQSYAIYCRLITKDGTTIRKDIMYPVSWSSKPISFTAGEKLGQKGDKHDILIHPYSDPELYANFAGIEFITEEEYNK